MGSSSFLLSKLEEIHPRHRDMIKDLIDDLLKVVGENLLLLVLFGSVARGVSHPRDIDLLIVTKDKGSVLNWNNRVKLIKKYGAFVDMAFLTPQ